MGPLLSRGVYRTPYLVKGLAALVAVDRHGVARKHLAMPPGADEARCIAWMEAKLELLDPVPQLVLVNPTKPRTPTAPRTIDADLYRDVHDKRRYWKMLAKNAANRLPPR